ncbi:MULTISPECIES: type II toxin-antitoxin system RelE/ParE family toxin [Dyadobacter]|uniref:Type II toxin-antitoxin system RelE/ParE family toxin n=1 Tax=Dyadobacter chenhuakuii TaxID=2909339 RepID=A0ABY4XP90_9BACT|nr:MULTISPECIES: type II toxin-antitoxin system RelE/ParE family toxin [Dyadobacter]MCE7072412.1 type II toxin-antitoxin system RelE/ParE family toxin [Dyadobacter sp. CY327]MCF2494539.1 type II toxin-antitoxin system RelE/ParE family toxin [Dyadobacter chenhuakuii]USJ32138.1 type II toxin-antitoxin system RelE/ParE family toxin [Dyadobacter chenhuakuii]
MIEITYTHEFRREYKRLAKKYPSLYTDIQKLIINLTENPTTGKPLGSEIFKIRWPVKSKGKGKSGGIRIITHFMFTDNELVLITIYDKSEKETIPIKEIRSIIDSTK